MRTRRFVVCFRCFKSEFRDLRSISITPHANISIVITLMLQRVHRYPTLCVLVFRLFIVSKFVCSVDLLDQTKSRYGHFLCLSLLFGVV